MKYLYYPRLQLIQFHNEPWKKDGFVYCCDGILTA